jgi:iron(III) transport system substrate-binding protein
MQRLHVALSARRSRDLNSPEKGNIQGGTRMPLLRRTLLIGAALAFAAFGAQAQDAVDEAAAKKEGKVVWYTSTPIELAQQIASDFQKDTGIKVELFRSGGSAILRRFQQEADAGLIAVDVLTHSDPGIADALAAKGMYVPFKPKNFDKVPEAAKDKDGRWVAQRLNMIALYYRTDLVAAADVPKLMTDLADPKYKGKMVMADPNFASLQVAVDGTLAEKLGWDFFKKLRENDIMVVQGAQQVVDMVKRGERPIAVAASVSYAIDAMAEGHKLDSFYPKDGTFLVASPTGVIKGSPNPNAAKLFAAYLLSEKQQQAVTKFGAVAALVDIAPPPGNPALSTLAITPVDYLKMEKETANIKRQFSKIFQ